MSQAAVCLDTELRKLRPAELYTLGQILNISDSWKKLMAIVPKEGTINAPKFNVEHFSMIEQAVHQQRRNPAEIFLEEWGTMGKHRPTLRVLLDLLVKAELFRAADYLAGDVLKEELPKRPQCGPAAPVDISDETIQKLLEEKLALCGDDSNELSLVLEPSSEINVEKIVYPPDVVLDAADQSSLERNMQSTKLALSRDEFNKKYLEANNDIAMHQKGMQAVPKVEMSDLIKFSTDGHNIENNLEIYNNSTELPEGVNRGNLQNNIGAYNYENVLAPNCVYERQEIATQELPAILYDFGQIQGQVGANKEMRSDELPVFINSDTHVTNSATSSDANASTSESSIDSLQTSNLNINQTEMMSVELPQCVLDLGSRSRQTRCETVNNVNVNGQDNTQNALTSQELPLMVLEYNG